MLAFREEAGEKIELGHSLVAYIDPQNSQKINSLNGIPSLFPLPGKVNKEHRNSNTQQETLGVHTLASSYFI